MSNVVNTNIRQIRVGDVEPSAIDLTRHMLPGESLTLASVVAGAGLSITSSAAIGNANAYYARTNRVMQADKYIQWTHTAVTASDSSYIDIQFTTSLGQTKKLRINFQVQL